MYGFEGKRLVAYFWFVGWDCISLGFHVCLGAPNVEVHLPFGFIRLGRKSGPKMAEVHYKTFPPQGWSFKGEKW